MNTASLSVLIERGIPNVPIASSNAFNTVTAIRRNAPLVLAPKVGRVPEAAQTHNLKN